ncbi:uncharacterized protein LOC8284183 isoform X2 [Ricinus communis]|uniref:uncharacterized protein LOC8284183 isoform X2 n=1 Tax=Ricinus communis TaxID=3988 RepID=UPI00201AA23A|nr:uncharacterized protein LOC8284183 isoform X2 [Ricinus communis]
MQQPRFNSYPPSQLPSQIQPINNSNTTAPVNPQASLANLCNMLQNSMPMQMQMQQQPQLGIIMNPQIQFPFNNNSSVSPFITQNQFGLPQLGFSPLNHLNHLNTVPMFVNQFNPSQLQPQQFPFNFPQQLNHNMGFPNLQNMNPPLPIQMPNLSQPVAPHNPNLFPIGHQPNTTQQAKGSTCSMPQIQNSPHFPSFKQQGNPINNGQNSSSSFKWKRFPNKDFKKNPKQESSKLGYQKSQFHHMNNGKRKFGEHNGNGYERATKAGRTVPTGQARETKRSPALIYTEQEIKLWREERRKNFPSKANIEKMCSERVTNSGGIDKEAKLRRERLKEILAKQAELGVEVAEIPSHYLSDSEKQVKVKKDSRRSAPKKGRSRHKHDRRGRYNKKDGLTQQNTLAKKDSSNGSSFSRTKPTLLQKLLSAEVRKDKHHLLQVFRFMVMNSFFDDGPEKPLKFPSVVVKEDEVVAEKTSITGKGISEVSNKTAVENSGHVGDGDEDDDSADDDGDKHGVRVGQGTSYAKAKFTLDQIDNRTEGEEGEIID